jgi:hypothetical protein
MAKGYTNFIAVLFKVFEVSKISKCGYWYIIYRFVAAGK